MLAGNKEQEHLYAAKTIGNNWHLLSGHTVRAVSNSAAFWLWLFIRELPLHNFANLLCLFLLGLDYGLRSHYTLLVRKPLPMVMWNWTLNLVFYSECRAAIYLFLFKSRS